MYRVYIVEDDAIIAGEIKRQIESWGLSACCAKDFRNVLGEFAQYRPQLVLLDLSLPFFNGYYWCEQIRKSSNVPIIFISSAADNMNIVMAVNQGADDFIAKPFDLSVLTAKIKAILRRSYDFAGSTSLLQHNGLLLNTADCTLLKDGEKLELTKNENRILHVLFEHSGSYVSRDTLMNRLWETDLFVDENTLSVNITRLRKKLESAGLPDMIKTKKGVGYMVE